MTSLLKPVARRGLLGALAFGGALAARAQSASAQTAAAEIKMSDIKKDTEIACVYHLDYADNARFDQMLRNINNHLSVHDFNPLAAKIVIVAHGQGIKFYLKDFEGTNFAGQTIPDEITQRMEGLTKYGVEVYLCKITFERSKLDIAKAKSAPWLRIVPSGVATVAALQSKGFAYIKVG